MDYYDTIVTDQDKCVAYIIDLIKENDGEITQEQATIVCNGGTVVLMNIGSANLGVLVSFGVIPASDYENAGLKVNVSKKYLQIDEEKCTSYLPTIGYESDACTKEANIPDLPYLVTKSDYDKAGITLSDKLNETIAITGYSALGGLDVVIPSYIDGKKVVEIAEYAFIGSGIIPEGISNTSNNYQIKKLNYSNGNNYVVKRLAGAGGLGIKSVVIPGTVKIIGYYAFVGNQLTNVTIPSSVTSIGNNAFERNPNIVITNNSSIENVKSVWNNIVGTSVIINGNVIKIGDD